MANSSAIELPNLPNTSAREAETAPLPHDSTGVVGQTQEPVFSLPPADGGVRAWLFLAGCFFIEALVWGKNQPVDEAPSSAYDYYIYQTKRES